MLRKPDSISCAKTTVTTVTVVLAQLSDINQPNENEHGINILNTPINGKAWLFAVRVAIGWLIVVSGGLWYNTCIN